MTKDAVINLRISSELKSKFQNACYEKRMKMTEAIEEALEQWIETDTTQSTQSIQDGDRASEIEQLKALISKQQEELDRIANLASTKVSREEVETALDNYTQNALEQYSIQWKYHLEQEINERVVTVREDLLKRLNRVEEGFYGLACGIDKTQTKSEEEGVNQKEMQEIIGGKISHNTIRTCAEGGGSKKSRSIYESLIEPYYWWCPDTIRFYKRKS